MIDHLDHIDLSDQYQKLKLFKSIKISFAVVADVVYTVPMLNKHREFVAGTNKLSIDMFNKVP